jgi:hypothetical protein
MFAVPCFYNWSKGAGMLLGSLAGLFLYFGFKISVVTSRSLGHAVITILTGHMNDMEKAINLEYDRFRRDPQLPHVKSIHSDLLEKIADIRNDLKNDILPLMLDGSSDFVDSTESATGSAAVHDSVAVHIGSRAKQGYCSSCRFSC